MFRLHALQINAVTEVEQQKSNNRFTPLHNITVRFHDNVTGRKWMNTVAR
jgi:hypothetical protein